MRNLLLISNIFCRLSERTDCFAIAQVAAAAVENPNFPQPPAMATSILHTASQSYPPPPPPFSQESTELSLSGHHLSQGTMPSFDGAQSIGSTPTPTPTASRGQRQISSFNTATYPPPNSIPIQRAPPKRYHEPNGVIPQQQYPPGHRPQIYTVRSLQVILSQAPAKSVAN